MPTSLSKEVCLRSIKVLDIGWAASAYFVMALATTAAVSRALGRFDPAVADAKSKLRLVLEVCAHVWLLGVCTYVARNVFPLVPWPLQGVCGYDHALVKEVTNAVVYSATVVTFDVHLQDQVAYLRKRLSL